MLNSSAAHNPCAELMRASNYGSGGGLGLILRSGLEIFVVDLIFPRLYSKKNKKNPPKSFVSDELKLLHFGFNLLQSGFNRRRHRTL